MGSFGGRGPIPLISGGGRLMFAGGTGPLDCEMDFSILKWNCKKNWMEGKYIYIERERESGSSVHMFLKLEFLEMPFFPLVWLKIIFVIEIIFVYWHLFGFFVPMGPEAVLGLIDFSAGNLIIGRFCFQNKITTTKVNIKNNNVSSFARLYYS